MTDIVERLRAGADGERELIAFEVREAADEIERLERERDTWRDVAHGRMSRAPLTAEPNGIENLKAILEDQPYQSSALSVYQITTILENKGGFMPDEAVVWFREWKS